jgi:hypothetical protein
MQDLTIELEDRPGALAEMGQALGAAGVSVEGGGVFTTGGRGLAHFLFHDSARAAEALRAAGITVVAERKVLVQRLRQDIPGQLGAICQQMTEAGVNIEVMYSDHDNQLVLVVDDHATGQRVSAAWIKDNQRTI